MQCDVQWHGHPVTIGTSIRPFKNLRRMYLLSLGLKKSIPKYLNWSNLVKQLFPNFHNCEINFDFYLNLCPEIITRENFLITSSLTAIVMRRIYLNALIHTLLYKCSQTSFRILACLSWNHFEHFISFSWSYSLQTLSTSYKTKKLHRLCNIV